MKTIKGGLPMASSWVTGKRRSRGPEWPWFHLERRCQGGQRRQLLQLPPDRQKEISYGTIGPSLYNYGKAARCDGDPTAEASKAIRGIHLGQAVELAGLQRLLAHATRRATKAF